LKFIEYFEKVITFL